MILAIDVGNTNIVIGCFDHTSIRFTARLSTDRFKTGDEYAVLISNLLSLYRADPAKIEGAILSSVVPPLKTAISDAVRIITGQRCMVVGSGIKTGLNILIDNPAQLGSDRVVDAVAALAEYKPPILIFDLGTATTASVVDRNGNYIGGMIIPGVMVGLDALSSRTSQLPRISLEPPRRMIGANTEDCMKSGILYGNAAMLDGIITRAAKELGEMPTVIAAGGLAKIIVPLCEQSILLDDDLTLKGLRILYEKNRLPQ